MNKPAEKALPRHNRRLMRTGGGPLYRNDYGEDLLRRHYERWKHLSTLATMRQRGRSNLHVT